MANNEIPTYISFISNKSRLYLPHLRLLVLRSLEDDLSQLALSHTCKLYWELEEDFRLQTLSFRDIWLDARDPTTALVKRFYAKRSDLGVIELTSRLEPASNRHLSKVIHPGKLLRCYTFE